MLYSLTLFSLKENVLSENSISMQAAKSEHITCNDVVLLVKFPEPCISEVIRIDGFNVNDGRQSLSLLNDNLASDTSVSEEQDDEEAFQLNADVDVDPRTWPGMNKQGGAGRIVAVNAGDTVKSHESI